MGNRTLNSKGVGLLTVLAFAGATGACATVSPDEMDTSLSQLRAELQGEIDANEQATDQLSGRVDQMEQRMSQLESDLQQMESDFEASIQQLEDQLRFNVPVYFGFDDATVEAEDEALLDRFGAVAQEYYPQATITVEGFTDPSGPEAYNVTLGQRRADAVAEYLTTNTGISADRMRAVSYGENSQRLIAPGNTGPGTEGWQNRRVVLVIDHDGQPPAMASQRPGPDTD